MVTCILIISDKKHKHFKHKIEIVNPLGSMNVLSKFQPNGSVILRGGKSERSHIHLLSSDVYLYSIVLIIRT